MEMNQERRKRLEQLEYDNYMGMSQFWTEREWDEYSYLVELNGGYIDIQKILNY